MAAAFSTATPDDQGALQLTGAMGALALAAVVSVFFVVRYVHETRGLELEEMEG